MFVSMLGVVAARLGNMTLRNGIRADKRLVINLIGRHIVFFVSKKVNNHSPHML